MTEIVLREYRLEDADDVAAACSDPATARFLPFLPHPYTHADAIEWITERVPAAVAAGVLMRVVADRDSDRLLGAVGLNPRGEGCAELGYWMAPWSRGRGLASAAARAVTASAFDSGSHRVFLRTEPENVASQRVAIAAGFVRESVQRAAGADRDGVGRHDLIVWVRLAGDPAGPSPRLLPDLPGRTATSRGELTDGLVCLRPLGPDDIEDTLAVHQLPDVIATSVPAEAPPRWRVERRCRQAEAAWLAGARADFTIRDAATGTHAGEIGLYYGDAQTQQAMIGYSMRPEWRGRGYATRAAELITAWAFEVGVARVIAGTAPDNEGSQRVLQRAGFTREGYQRSRLPGPGGTRIDDVLWARVPADPPRTDQESVTPSQISP